jgi:hypothetical protein
MENAQEGLSTAGTPARDMDDVRTIAEKCQSLVEQAAVGFVTRTQFLDRLKESGASADEANDYVEQLSQRLQGQQQSRDLRDQAPSDQGHVPRASPDRELTPEGLGGQDLIDFRTRRDAILSASADKAKELEESEKRKRAAEAVAWAVLQAKLAQLDYATPLGNDHPSGSFSEDLVNLLGLSRSSSGSIPSSVLAVAPHLGKLSSQIKSDPHLDQTRKYRIVFNKSDQVRDSLINDLQLVSLAEPIPRSIWKKIVQDDFVEFEKLYASMDRGYDHKDEPKSLSEDFAIVKKDQASAKRPLHTEAEWIRVFSAWEAGVVLLFPHRASELQTYRQVVMELFRAAPERPQLAIQFDLEVRDRYAKKPFHMDDRSQHNIPLLAQMFRSASSPLSKSNKRGSSSSSTVSSKRADTPCRNWSLGKCNDPCTNRRKHGVCCICGEKHRAKENELCLASLQARA